MISRRCEFMPCPSEEACRVLNEMLIPVLVDLITSYGDPFRLRARLLGKLEKPICDAVAIPSDGFMEQSAHAKERLQRLSFENQEFVTVETSNLRDVILETRAARELVKGQPTWLGSRSCVIIAYTQRTPTENVYKTGLGTIGRVAQRIKLTPSRYLANVGDGYELVEGDEMSRSILHYKEIRQLHRWTRTPLCPKTLARWGDLVVVIQSGMVVCLQVVSDSVHRVTQPLKAPHGHFLTLSVCDLKLFAFTHNGVYELSFET